MTADTTASVLDTRSTSTVGERRRHAAIYGVALAVSFTPAIMKALMMMGVSMREPQGSALSALFIVLTFIISLVWTARSLDRESAPSSPRA